VVHKLGLFFPVAVLEEERRGVAILFEIKADLGIDPLVWVR